MGTYKSCPNCIQAVTLVNGLTYKEEYGVCVFLFIYSTTYFLQGLIGDAGNDGPIGDPGSKGVRGRPGASGSPGVRGATVSQLINLRSICYYV